MEKNNYKYTQSLLYKERMFSRLTTAKRHIKGMLYHSFLYMYYSTETAL